MTNKQRILIIAAGVVGFVILAVITFFSLRPTITITTDVEGGLDKITINDKEQNFTNGMKLSYSSTLKISASKDGYKTGSWTLDPAKQKISTFNVTLERTSIGTDTSENAKIIDSLDSPKTTQEPVQSEEILLAAAVQSGESTLLDFGSALNVDVKDYRIFAADGYYGFVVTPKPPIVADNAIVIVKKINSDFSIIVGPGTSFNSSEVASLPTRVADFMREKGFVYD